MLAEIIRLLLATACFLFVLSLPLSKTDTGAALRRWAGVCFSLAFLPSLIAGIFFSHSPPVPGSAPEASTPAVSFFSSLGCLTFVLVLSAAAYGVLSLRRRFTAKTKPRDPWEAFFIRGGGKRPFTMRPDAGRTRAPYARADDEDDD